MGDERKNMLNDGGRTLISVIKSYLQNKPLPKINDYKCVFLVAKRHSLGNLLYFALQNEQDVPPGVKDVLIDSAGALVGAVVALFAWYLVVRVFEKRKMKRLA